jgi:hypothetical protein
LISKGSKVKKVLKKGEKRKKIGDQKPVYGRKHTKSAKCAIALMDNYTLPTSLAVV